MIKRWRWMMALGLLIAIQKVFAGLPDPIYFRVQMEVGAIGKAEDWLDDGLPPDFMGDRIGSGLMIGAWEGNVKLMELFLSRGADVNKANDLNETALMHAAWKGRTRAVEWLLARGAQPNRQNMEWTALHYAVFAGHKEAAELLLQKGADMNAKSPNGSSVLMMAVYEGRADMVRWALDHGANPAIRNEKGQSALDWAMKYQRADIARMVSSSEEFAKAANRPRSEWGEARQSRTAPADLADMLQLRETLKDMQRQASLQARRKNNADTLASLTAQHAARRIAAQAPTVVMEISALRRDPIQQRIHVRMENNDDRR